MWDYRTVLLPKVTVTDLQPTVAPVNPCDDGPTRFQISGQVVGMATSNGGGGDTIQHRQHSLCFLWHTLGTTSW
jgi:hypothetical protein